MTTSHTPGGKPGSVVKVRRTEIYARVAAGTPADITRAADAAQAAFPGWSAMGAFERREIFLRATGVMAGRGEEVITALDRETGASRLFSEFNLAFCIQVLREAAAAITRPMGELLPASIPGACSLAQRVPFGVVGAISPWNAPLVPGIRSIAIPLAVGNTVVMKPSEDAPVTCGLLLADVLAEAGLPAGVLNVVTNDLADAGQVVAALIAGPRVRMVNFTGSTNVGRIIGVQAARHLKPATPPIPPRSSDPSSIRAARSASPGSSKTPPPRGPACSPATERSRGRTGRSSGRSCSPASGPAWTSSPRRSSARRRSSTRPNRPRAPSTWPTTPNTG